MVQMTSLTPPATTIRADSSHGHASPARYQALLSQLETGHTAETQPIALPQELELQAMWFAGLFGREFRGTLGEVITIQQFGEWNRAAGPDFRLAVIQCNGEMRRGDIEIDSHVDDWEGHGHAANADFRDVILHVCFRTAAATTMIRTDLHRHVPQVHINDAELAIAMQLPRRQVAVARPGRCLAPLQRMPADELCVLLEDAALHRAQQKAKRFRLFADAQGRETALYAALAQTLGYARNRVNMLLLSQRVPLSVLRDHQPDSEAMLLGCAGFLSPDWHHHAETSAQRRMESLWHRWWRHRAQLECPLPIPWVLHGQRPAHHPQRRIAALACVVQQWSSFCRVALARPFCPQAVLDFIEKVQHPFWSLRHTLHAQPSGRPIALLGRQLGLELLANHLIPLALAEDPAFGVGSYHKLAGTAGNDALRRVALRLFGSHESAQPWLRRLSHQQGLLQIYHDFCLEDVSDCSQCRFPEQLAQWHV